jgi:hypothetical protein
MIIVLSAWLSKKINSPVLAALLGLVLIGTAIYGLAATDMPTVVAIVIVIVGVMNLLRLLPHSDEQASEEKRPDSLVASAMN